jgi:thymidylate synthase (FAD)
MQHNIADALKIRVLDHGYVRFVDVMGDDLSVVNAARVSYDKESPGLNDKDENLLRYLWRNGHTSPFRHAAISFEVYAPLMVARQWYKHAVASTHTDDQSGWNESSRRYVTEEPTFHIPHHWEWRGAPGNSKQGSEGFIPVEEGEGWTARLEDYVDEGIRLYEEAQDAGIASEQARLFLPAYGMYVRWRWTVSLHGVLHFLNLRVEHSAQYEIQQYAKAVKWLVAGQFPATVRAVANAETTD